MCVVIEWIWFFNEWWLDNVWFVIEKICDKIFYFKNLGIFYLLFIGSCMNCNKFNYYILGKFLVIIK